jgi:hypothetical protein
MADVSVVSRAFQRSRPFGKLYRTQVAKISLQPVRRVFRISTIAGCNGLA